MIPDIPVSHFLLPADLTQTEQLRLVDPRVAAAQERRNWLRREQARLDGLHQQQPAPAPEVGLAVVDLAALPPIDDWMERNCYDYTEFNPVTLKPKNRATLEPMTLQPFQREILRHIFPVGGYRGNVSKYTTVIWSQVKKSGKTQIAANVGSYFAENIDPPNVILAVANKKEQAEDRVYRSMKPTIKMLGAAVPTSSTSKPVMTLDNGTQVRALPNSPATEAGDSYCLTLWTEIWAFKNENDERLFAELMPVATRRVSMRWIETYAGYWDESLTLKRHFQKAFTHSDEKDLAPGARFVPELMHITTDQRPACIEVPDEGLFIFWDHERRMPWQTDEKYKREFKSLPKVEAVRLLQNRWQSSSSDLLEPAWIEAAHVTDVWLEAYRGHSFTLAVDASQRHDSTALIGSFKEQQNYYTPFIEIYDPHGQDIDLHAVVEQRVKALFDEGVLTTYWDVKQERYVTPVYFDPYQLHQIRLNLIAYGVDVIEFNQGEPRTRADTMLYHAYRDGLVHIPGGRPDFYEHLLGGKAKYSEGEKLRIQKGTTVDSKRIDALVGQSMSMYGAFLAEQAALTNPQEIGVLAMGSASNSWFGGGGDD